LDLRSVPEQIL